VIALSVRPAPPSAAAPIPAGNRRGTFAAGPEGKPAARGTPDTPGKETGGVGAGESHDNGNGAGNEKSATGLPPGLVVGKAPESTAASAVVGNDGSNRLTASITPPRLTTGGHNHAKAVLPENATPVERRVFGNRTFYSMMLNLPNLNSSGGSWVLRFAQMGEEKDEGDLNGPVATQTSDPAYPMELMRKNVQGTVTLYAVIHEDGTVGEVRVLDGVNDRLDEYAREALLRWKFQPATKNGSPVALEAVVRIPFRPFHFQSSF
jgi:TonB family protein